MYFFSSTSLCLSLSLSLFNTQRLTKVVSAGGWIWVRQKWVWIRVWWDDVMQLLCARRGRLADHVTLLCAARQQAHCNSHAIWLIKYPFESRRMATQLATQLTTMPSSRGRETHVITRTSFTPRQPSERYKLREVISEVYKINYCCTESADTVVLYSVAK